MYRLIEGSSSAEGLRFALIASRFNDEIVSLLLEGAVDCLKRHGAIDESITVYRVPGAFEIPTLAAKLAPMADYDAIIALGALIRGETPHFEYISSQVTHQLSRASVESKKPVAFGVITCDTFEQARARTAKGSNKGWEAALAAIEMATLWKKL